MTSKHITTVVCAACLAYAGFAEQIKTVTDETKNQQPQEIEESESSIVSAEVYIDFCSRQLSYGLADNQDPIMMPGATLTFFDIFTVSMDWIMDTTHRGRKAGYRDRRWQYQEFDPGISAVYSFSPEDYSFLPTTIELGVGYMYEYHPRFSKSKSDDVNGNPDTQFVMFDIALPDLCLEPTLNLEWDIDRDDGFYANLNVGHSFELIAGKDEDPLLALRIEAGQGLGSADRNNAYLEVDKWGLMDTSIALKLEYQPCSWLTITPYVAYYDYLFDRKLRHAARGYNEKIDDSFNFIGGITIAATF